MFAPSDWALPPTPSSIYTFPATTLMASPLQASARMRARQLPGPKPYYVTAEQPDMWFDAAEVWEIRGADLTISPVHKVGGLGLVASCCRTQG